MQFTKQISSVPEQIALLRRRGLVITDEPAATTILSNISYYRLSIYMRFFQVTGSAHQFHPGITLEQVHDLYLFDRELKLVIFDAIETLEVAIRNQLTLNICPVHGNNWYENSGLFDSAAYHRELMAHIKDEFDESEERFIAHYRNTYTQPTFPPSWMILEIMTFGKLSRIYQHLSCLNEKRDIARYFKTHENIFTSWLHALAYLRNLCAHHSRLVGRTLTITPMMPSKKSNKILAVDADNRSLYAFLCVISYMLGAIGSANKFRERVINLTATLPGLRLERMGFTPDWQQEAIWQI
jgi:abortive infection bacteriophage resistance protein